MLTSRSCCSRDCSTRTSRRCSDGETSPASASNLRRSCAWDNEVNVEVDAPHAVCVVAPGITTIAVCTRSAGGADPDDEDIRTAIVACVCELLGLPAATRESLLVRALKLPSDELPRLIHEMFPETAKGGAAGTAEVHRRAPRRPRCTRRAKLAGSNALTVTTASSVASHTRSSPLPCRTRRLRRRPRCCGPSI